VAGEHSSQSTKGSCRLSKTIITYWLHMSRITCKWFGCCGIARVSHGQTRKSGVKSPALQNRGRGTCARKWRIQGRENEGRVAPHASSPRVEPREARGRRRKVPELMDTQMPLKIANTGEQDNEGSPKFLGHVLTGFH